MYYFLYFILHVLNTQFSDDVLKEYKNILVLADNINVAEPHIERLFTKCTKKTILSREDLFTRYVSLNVLRFYACMFICLKPISIKRLSNDTGASKLPTSGCEHQIWIRSNSLKLVFHPKIKLQIAMYLH